MTRLELDPKTVRTKADLVKFVASLRQDLLQNSDEWESPTLESFLESLGGWIADCDVFYQGPGNSLPPEATWTFVAQALLAASAYE
jgi:hypothetical protein